MLVVPEVPVSGTQCITRYKEHLTDFMFNGGIGEGMEGSTNGTNSRLQTYEICGQLLHPLCIVPLGQGAVVHVAIIYLITPTIQSTSICHVHTSPHL